MLAARLETEYGVAAEFLPTRTVHVERVAGTGEGDAATAMGNAQLGLRVEPRPGRAPASTTPSARASSAATCCRRSTSPSRRRWPRELAEGLHGWRLTDLRVRVVHARFSAPTPSAGEFRAADHHDVPRGAARRPGPPSARRSAGFELGVPAESLTAVLAALVGRGRHARAGRGRHLPLPRHRHHPDRRGRRVRTTAARPHLGARRPPHPSRPATSPCAVPPTRVAAAAVAEEGALRRPRSLSSETAGTGSEPRRSTAAELGPRRRGR